MTEYQIRFYGEILDGALTRADAEALRADYVADVWAGRYPDLVTADDFDSRAECDAAFTITTLTY